MDCVTINVRDLLKEDEHVILTDVDASSRCLRSPSGSGYTCKPGFTHYHIVITFEAKESRAPGVVAQSHGISERLERLSEACFKWTTDTLLHWLIRSEDQVGERGWADVTQSEMFSLLRTCRLNYPQLMQRDPRTLHKHK